MTITSIEVIGGVNPFAQANTVIMTLVRDHGSLLGDAPFAAIADYYPSPVDRVVKCAEAFYAAALVASPGDPRDAIAAGCASLADFCTANGFHAMGQTDRGMKMSGACLRLVGLGAQAEADDPAVLPELVD